MSQLICSVCGHSVRPYRTKAADYPGTRKRVGDKCKVCHENKLHLSNEGLAQREKAKNATRCLSCHKPMRPKGTKARDFPGTVMQDVYGKCNSCYKRGGPKGRSFTEDTLISRLDDMPVPKVEERDYRIVRRLIEDRFEGDDYLLSVLGLVGEDTE